jgi:hypothetical protein
MLEKIGLICLIVYGSYLCLDNDPMLGVVILLYLIIYFGLDAWSIRYRSRKRREESRAKIHSEGANK